MNIRALFSLAVIMSGILALSVAEPVITEWSRGRAGAFSLTFDDQIQGQFTVGVPAMNERGIRGSIYISSVDADITAAAAAGHEIGSHTWGHWCFDDPLVTAQVENEYSTHTAHINEAILQQKCATLVWPCGGAAATARTIAKDYYIACRNLGSDLETAPVAPEPVDMYQIPSWTGCNPDYQGTANGYISHAVQTTVQHGGWMVFTYHVVGSASDGYNDVTAETFAMELDTLKAHEETLWTAPFGDVARYIWERKYGTVTEIASNENQMTFQLTNSLETVFATASFIADSIFNQPLTLSMPMPSGWSGATVSQNGQTMWSRIADGGGTSVLLFEAKPEQGEIVVASGETDIRNSPVKQHATFSASPESGRQFDIRGRAICAGKACAGIRLTKNREKRFWQDNRF